MKLRNKKTGEVATLTLSSNGEDLIIMGNDMYAHITKLSELKDYEDYEEEKRYWYIDADGEIMSKEMAWFNQAQDNIGNRFETREEAEKAVEKLKAAKRLKDAGISFRAKVIDRNWYLESKGEPQQRTFDEAHDLFKDIMFVFGGEE